MQFGYTIVYVDNVEASIDFFERAFGLQRAFVSPDGEFGTLATGSTALAFCQHATALDSVGQPYVVAQTSPQPLGIEIGLVTAE
ncbi:MAG: glyoxalase, partial [Burkholderiales bacterium PBB5]